MTSLLLQSDNRKSLSFVLAVACWTAALLILFWAFTARTYRDAEGLLLGTIGLPVAIGVTLIVAGFAYRLGKAALWLALLVVGQAAALQLIDAGTGIHYQHYRPLTGSLLDTHRLALFCIAIQFLLVGYGIFRERKILFETLKRNLRVWQILVFLSIFIFTSAAISASIKGYLAELAFASFLQLINLANLALVVLSIPGGLAAALQKRFEPLFREPEPGKRSLDRVALLGAIWVALMAALLSFFVYERHPHIPDEVIYLFHAKSLANGLFTVPAPPVPEAFSFYLIPDRSAQWYSIFPPGWPALLALGSLAGVPWLVNPILAGINLFLVSRVLEEIYSRRVARLGVLLLCLSPWYLFMSMNFMSHTATLTCFLAATLAVILARKTGKARYGLIAGAAIGYMSLIRPQDAAIIAVLLGLWAIGLGGSRLSFPALVNFGLGILLVGLLIFPYNRLVTGDPLVFPLSSYYKEYFGPLSNAFGFGPGRGLGWPLDAFPGHSLLESLVNNGLNLFSVNIELFGWSTGSLVLIVLLLTTARLVKTDFLMLAVLGGVIGIFSLYWFNGGPDFGARYWYLAILPFIALSVRGLLHLMDKLDRQYSSRMFIAVIALCFVALVNYLPWRALDKYHHYLGMRPDIEVLAREHNFGKSLVLIQGSSHPDYQSAWVYNPLDEEADQPIYAWDKNDKVRKQVLEAYPDRPVWIIRGPSVTQSGYEIVSGPLLGSQLLTNSQAVP